MHQRRNIESRLIRVSDLPEKLLKAHIDTGPVFFGLSYKEAKQQVLNSFSKEFIERLLRVAKGNVTEAAKQSKMDGANFRRLMRKCGVQLHEGQGDSPCQR